MNPLLKAIAATLFVAVAKVNQAVFDREKAVAEPTAEEKSVLATLETHYRNTNESIAKMIAEILSATIPSLKNLNQMFLKKVGALKNDLVWEPLTMLTSLNDFNHRIPAGQPFLVLAPKQKHAVLMDGTLTTFHNHKDSCRLATPEEVKTYFENLSPRHLGQFVQNELTAAVVDEASKRLVMLDEEKKGQAQEQSAPAAENAAPATA
jgi:hypothetical protein